VNAAPKGNIFSQNSWFKFALFSGFGNVFGKRPVKIRNDHPNFPLGTKDQLMLFGVATLVLLFYAWTHLLSGIS